MKREKKRQKKKKEKTKKRKKLSNRKDKKTKKNEKKWTHISPFNLMLIPTIRSKQMGGADLSIDMHQNKSM